MFRRKQPAPIINVEPEALHLEDGDVVVVKFDARIMNVAPLVAIRETLKVMPAFIGHEVIIVERGVELSTTKDVPPTP
jgi:hypothetical protein